MWNTCGKGWGQRCATANPHTACRCSCDGENHGIYWVFRKRTPRTPRIPPPPPLPDGDDHDGDIIPWETEDWFDTVLHDRAAFAAGLKELGFDQKSINQGLEHYDAATRLAANGSRVSTWSSFTSEEERSAFKKFIHSHIAKSRLAHWLRILDIKIEETTTERINLPLFKLHSPKVERSKVSYVDSQANASAAPWSITVFGSGMGRTRKFALRFRSTFESSNGDCKLISVPITMKVERVTTYALGQVIGRGFRSELILEGPEKTSNSIDSLPDEECSRELDATEGFDYEAEFSGDRSNAVHKVEWTLTSSESTEIKRGLDAFETAIDCNTIIEREREIGLTFELPAGHRYELKKCSEVRGVVWAVDRQRSDEVVAVEETIADPVEKPGEPVFAVSSEVEPEEYDVPGLTPLPEAVAEADKQIFAVSDGSPDGSSDTPQRSSFKELLKLIGHKLSKFWKELKKPS